MGLLNAYCSGERKKGKSNMQWNTCHWLVAILSETIHIWKLTFQQNAHHYKMWTWCNITLSQWLQCGSRRPQAWWSLNMQTNATSASLHLLEHPTWGNTRRRNTMSVWQGVTFCCMRGCCRANQILVNHYCQFLQLHRISVIGGQHICTEGHCYTLMLEAVCSTYTLCQGNRSVVSPAYRTLVTAWSTLCTGQLDGGLALLKVLIRVNTWVLGICQHVNIYKCSFCSSWQAILLDRST